MSVPPETRNESINYRQVYFFLSLERKYRQVAKFLSMLLRDVAPCTHSHTQEVRFMGQRDTVRHSSSRCLPEVLRGSSASFRGNALFVDKSKLMTVRREAFGGKILLTLLRLNLTTEQDTSSCRNDRLL